MYKNGGYHRDVYHELKEIQRAVINDTGRVSWHFESTPLYRNDIALHFFTLADRKNTFEIYFVYANKAKNQI